MTLHEKIIELKMIAFDVKFEPSTFDEKCNIYVGLRYHGIGGTKIENRKMITHDKFINEKFLVSVIDDIYKEMKPHAIGHATLQLDND